MTDHNQDSVDRDDLEAALDGLMDASRYADAIGEDDLAFVIANSYQRLAKVSPEDHWDETTAEEIDELLSE